MHLTLHYKHIKKWNNTCLGPSTLIGHARKRHLYFPKSTELYNVHVQKKLSNTAQRCQLEMKSLILHKIFPRPHWEGTLQANQIQHLNVVAQNLLLGTSASARMFSPLPNPFYVLPNVFWQAKYPALLHFEIWVGRVG